ncbi:MAG: C40 family peptidase [Aromatoleum sp.]|nr:C40 family peptidase [Aromatoleum sp.]
MLAAPPRLKRLAAAFCCATLTAVAPLANAEDGGERSLAQMASASVTDAATSAWATARDLTSSALELLGVRYKWGGSAPRTGLDCSGLVQYVFQQVTGVTLPRSAKEMSRVGEQIALGDLMPGDLVFFNTRRFAYSHVGIYLGDNRFIHAPRRGREVEVATIDNSYWQKHFNGARRLVGVLPEMMPALVSEAAAAPLEAPSSAAPRP